MSQSNILRNFARFDAPTKVEMHFPPLAAGVRTSTRVVNVDGRSCSADNVPDNMTDAELISEIRRALNVSASARPTVDAAKPDEITEARERNEARGRLPNEARAALYDRAGTPAPAPEPTDRIAAAQARLAQRGALPEGLRQAMGSAR